jgi:hypothetical protein
MFVYYYTYVSRPFADIEQELERTPGCLLGQPGAPADGSGEGIVLDLGARRGVPVRKQVVLHTGAPDCSPRRMIVPLSVEALGTPGLFPRLEGELELAPFDDHLTQLTLRGRYRPPLGTVGEHLDEALLHRVTEAGIKDLLDQVAARLTCNGADRPLEAGAIDS